MLPSNELGPQHCIVVCLPLKSWTCQGNMFDMLNLNEGHQGHFQCHSCLAISLICMSLLYHARLSGSALQLISDQPVCV